MLVVKNNEKLMKIRYPLKFIIFHYSKNWWRIMISWFVDDHVQTRMYCFAQSCSGGQDSRWTLPSFLLHHMLRVIFKMHGKELKFGVSHAFARLLTATFRMWNSTKFQLAISKVWGFKTHLFWPHCRFLNTLNLF